jgi:hypothetical protein
MKLPPFPCNIDKTRSHKAIDGRKVTYTIEDEIVQQQKSASNPKLIYFQKMRFAEDNRIEYRFTYYMLGYKTGARGRWVFGQYSLLIPPQDLSALLRKARQKKWKGI